MNRLQREIIETKGFLPPIKFIGIHFYNINDLSDSFEIGVDFVTALNNIIAYSPSLPDKIKEILSQRILHTTFSIKIYGGTFDCVSLFNNLCYDELDPLIYAINIKISTLSDVRRLVVHSFDPDFKRQVLEVIYDG